MTEKEKIIEWTSECDPATWLLEEYKLLSKHYFHEDIQLKKTITLFTSLNAGLLGFLNSSFVSANSEILVFIPIVGVVLCFSWLASMVRIREIRNFIEERIKVIEDFLHKKWTGISFDILNIRRFKDWRLSNWKITFFNWPLSVPYRIFRNVPASISYFVLPSVFVIIWIIFIIKYI